MTTSEVTVSPEDRYSDDYERAAGGLDFDDDPVSGRARSLGDAFVSGGPEALLEEVENLIPDSWRGHIAQFPITALAVGFGVGLFLGMKRGPEVISAASAMFTAAATSSLGDILHQE